MKTKIYNNALEYALGVAIVCAVAWLVITNLVLPYTEVIRGLQRGLGSL